MSKEIQKTKKAKRDWCFDFLFLIFLRHSDFDFQFLQGVHG